MRCHIPKVCSLLLVLISLAGLTAPARSAEPSNPSAPSAPPMPTVPDAGGQIKLPPLPYAQDALEPFISARTMSFHYGKHHQTYVDTLNKLIATTPLAGQPLEKIVEQTAAAADKTAIFNNAAQVLNHNFFWQSMKPGGGGPPTGRMQTMIDKAFGSYEEFKKAFTASALAQFGSGWVWLVQDDQTLKIIKTSNAETPAAHGQTVLLTCDVWEHAYYLDYQNRRKDFVETFLDHLVNWDFAASQLK